MRQISKAYATKVLKAGGNQFEVFFQRKKTEKKYKVFQIKDAGTLDRMDGRRFDFWLIERGGK
jgi:hypothetical protein